MQVLIHCGQDDVDYTEWVLFDNGTSITRSLNQPTVCRLQVLTDSTGSNLPMPLSRVQIKNSAGSLLFTGYTAGSPGLAVQGPGMGSIRFVATVVAISDEYLLDAPTTTIQSTLLQRNAQETWNLLQTLLPSTRSTLSLSATVSGTSRTEIKPGSRWSMIAGSLADATATTYRALNGTISVANVGQTTHIVQASDPGLVIDNVGAKDLQWLASDYLICGRKEPKAYVTELFQDDGTTDTFALTYKAFTPATSQKVLIADVFQGTSLNGQVWQTNDAGAHVSLTAAGLTCLGGTGRYAEATVCSLQELELGGSLTLEATGVQITGGSQGTLLGLFGAANVLASCFAAFQVSTSSAGVTSLSALVGEAAAGSSFVPQAGHLYTLRMRVFSLEMERVRQSYFYFGIPGVSSTGGQTVPSSGQLEFEIQDLTSGSPGVPFILYSGPAASLPASCVLSLLQSGNLLCSMKSVSCTQTSPLWITMGQSGNVPANQFLDPLVDGGTCQVSSSGGVRFFPGFVPSTGALVYAQYRTEGYAVARRALPSSVQPTSSMGWSWVGSVEKPVAWSSLDCENAADALLAMASSGLAALKGGYKTQGAELSADLWPGDTLSLTGVPGTSVPLLACVKEVRITATANVPEVLEYAATFANEQAEALSIRLSQVVPEEAVLPQSSTTLANALESLSNLTIVEVSSSLLNVNTGIQAPVDGGFEIRRRDNTFGPGVDSDLVLRAMTSDLLIPRAAAIEEFYIRMFDGASPPNYSLFSAAVILNIPL